MRSPRTVLSARQQQVLELVCKGYTATQIAKMLNIGRRTAEGHKVRINEKFFGDHKGTIFQILTKAIELKLVNCPCGRNCK